MSPVTLSFRRLLHSLRLPLLLLLTQGAGAAEAALDFRVLRESTPYESLSVSTGAQVLTFSDRNNGRASIPLPFGFRFSGTGYSTSAHLVVCVNGYAYFSTFAVTGAGTADNAILYSTTAPNALLAPWFDDLSAEAVGTNPPGDVLYQVLGTSPSRRLVVQWTDVSSWPHALSGQPHRLNFQVTLFEVDDIIHFSYGPATGGPGSSQESASIGIEAGSGGSGNFLDLVSGSADLGYRNMHSARFPSGVIRLVPGDPRPLPAGTYTVGTEGDYPGLTEAVAALNHRGIEGAVTLSLLDAEYDSTRENFPILLGRIGGASSTNTITIEPASGVSTFRYGGSYLGFCGTPFGSTAISPTNEPILGLIGAAHVRLRNLHLASTGPGWVDRGLLLQNARSTQGARDNLFENLSIELDRSNPMSIGLEQHAFGTPADTASANSRNVYRDLAIANAARGVHLRGHAQYADRDCRIESSPGGSTVIGGDQPDDLVMSAGDGWGVRATNQVDFVLKDVTVRNVGTLVSGYCEAIWLDNSGMGSSSSGTTWISGNLVHGIVGTATAARGIRVDLPASAASEARVHNNMIYGIDLRSPSNTAVRVAGIVLQPTGTGTGARHEVHFNSIRLEPTGLGCSNACLQVGSSATTVRAGSNILANFTGPQTGTARHYNWSVNSTGTGPAEANRNVLYLASPVNGATANVAGSSASLDTWRSLNNTPDLLSLPYDPWFVSATDLHIRPDVQTPVEGRGGFLGGSASWIGVDRDGDPRQPAAPDIGADEGSFQPAMRYDLAGFSVVAPTGTAVTAGTSFPVRISFANLGTLTTPSTAGHVRISGPAPDSTVHYFETATIPGILPGGTATVTFPNGLVGQAGTYTVAASSELVDDVNPGNNSVSGSFSVPTPLSGNYSIGSSQPAPFHTLTSALAELQLRGASGPVIYEVLNSPYFSTGETSPLTIAPYPGAGPDAPFTLRPAPGVTTKFRGRGLAAFKLDGADYITIDGSNNGTDSRDLTIEVSPDFAYWGVGIWLASRGPGAGCTNNVVKNLRIVCEQDARAAGNNSMGIYMGNQNIQIVEEGADNDGNLFLNNEILRAGWGFWLRGTAGNPNSGNQIVDNVIGTASFGTNQIGKGGIVLLHQDSALVQGNLIRNIGLPEWNGAVGADRFGIALGDYAWPPVSRTALRNSRVEGNVIENVFEQGTRSAVGILLAPTTGPTGNAIVNNMIRDVRANGTGDDHAAGIAVSGGSGDIVAFNSVRLSGDLDAAGSPAADNGATGLRIGTPEPVALIAVNNILSLDVTADDSLLTHRAVVVPSNEMVFAAPGLDRNNYDVPPNSGRFQVGAIGAGPPFTPVATLEAWRSQFSPPQDGASVAVPTPFLGATDLHLNPGATTPLRGGALPLAEVVTDLDGDERDGSMPDIGADEVVVLPRLSLAATADTEGNAGVKPVSVALSLSPPAVDTVRAFVVTLAGTASPDTDFVAIVEPLSIVIAPGDSLENLIVEFIGDLDVEVDESFLVRVVGLEGATAEDSTGLVTIVNDDAVSGVGDSNRPPAFRLGPVVPHPVVKSAMIQLELASPGQTRLELFDVAGRRCGVLLDEVLPAGRHEREFRPSDMAGRPLASGTYFLRLSSGGTTRRERVVILGSARQDR